MKPPEAGGILQNYTTVM